MAVEDTVEKYTVTCKLNNGTQDGKVKTVSVPIGTLHPSRYNDQKALNIVNALKPCFSKPYFETVKVTTSTLTDSE